MRRAISAQRGRSSLPFRAESRVGRRRARRCAVGIEVLEGRTLLSMTVPLGPLQFVGDFAQDGNTYTISSGTAEIGFTPAAGGTFTPLVSIGGALQVTTGTGQFTFSGEWDAVIAAGPPIALWQAATTTTVSVAALTQTGQPLGSGAQGVAVTGTTFTPDEIVLAKSIGGTAGPGVRLQGSLAVPALPGLTLPVDGTNFVDIGRSGVASFSVSLSQGFDLFGFPLEVPGGEALTVKYVPSQQEFTVSGDVRAPELFDASVTLGSAGQQGLVIKDGTFQLDNFSLALGHVDLGAFVIENIAVSFSQGGDISGTLDMWLPEAEASIGGKITLVNGKVDDISLTYSDTEGIELGDTGLFLTTISASVQNIDDPSNLVVSGGIGVDFGPGLSILNENVSLFRAEGSFTVDRNELVLSGAVGFGAVADDNCDGQVTGLLGEGSATMTLDWGARTYSIQTTASMDDGVFRFDAGFSFNALGDITISAQADVDVPEGIPFIGGKTLAQLAFVFVYDRPTQSGYAAAWVELDIVHKFDIGIKYDLDKHLSVIGTSQIEALETPTGTSDKVFTYSSTFNVPGGATQAMFGVDYNVTGGTQWVAITVPNSATPIPQSDFSAQNGLSLLAPPQNAVLYPLGNELASRVNIVGSALSPTAPLAPGSYTLTLYSTVELDEESPNWTTTFSYPPPTISVAAPGVPPNVPVSSLTIPLQASVAPGLAGATTISVFADTDGQNYDGFLIERLPYQAGPLSATWDLSGVLPVPYSFYAVIDDGTDTPVFSAYTAAVTPAPVLSGSVSDTNNVAMAGISVGLYINGMTTPIETTLTGPSGVYAFDAVPDALSYAIGLILPPGVTLAGGTNPTPFTYQYPNGVPVSVSFRLVVPTSAAGAVTDAASGDGVPGVTVYADLNNDGQFDGGDPSAVTDANGVYRIIGLPENATVPIAVVVPAAYVQNPPDTVSVTTNNDPTQWIPNVDFKLTQLADITGLVQDDQGNPLPGWYVDLLDSSGNVVQTVQTSAGGVYHFYVPPGNYTVSEHVPSDYRQVSPFAGVFGMTTSVMNVGAQVQTVAAGVAFFDGSTPVSVLFTAYTEQSKQGNVINLYLFDVASGQFLFDQVLALLPIDDIAALTVVQSASALPNLLVLGGNGEVFFIPFLTDQPMFSVATLDHFSDLRGALVGDFDGDGTDDVAYSYSGRMAVLLSSQQYADPTYYDLKYTGGGAAGDVNNDGKLDLVVNSGNTNTQFAVYYGNGDGTFQDPTFYDFNLVGVTNGGNLALADFNRDGLLDVALTDDPSSSSSVGLYFALQAPAQNGFVGYVINHPSFTKNTTFPTIIAQDLNGDLWPDLVFTNSSGSFAQVNAFINQGPGASYFQNAPLNDVYSAVNAYPTYMASGDFNHDGLPDLVAADSSDGVDVLMNSSTENLGTTAANPTTGGPFQVPPFVNVAVGQISGLVYDDENRDGVKEPGEPGLAGATIYLDLNNNGRPDPGEPRTTTSATGAYRFDGLPPGTYTIRTVLDAGRIAVGPAPHATVGASRHAAVDLGTAERLLSPVPDLRVAEGSPLALTIGTTLAARGHRLRFALGPNAPDGLAIDPQTGLLTWTPSESQGPGVYLITVSVRELDEPAVVESLTFRVSVSEVNRPPAVTPIPDQSVSAGETLAFLVRASDPDVPAQRPSFALAPGAPAGAAIDPATGRFTWTPSENTPPGLYRITVLVSDDGAPSQLATAAFTVNVLPPAGDVRFMRDAFVSLLGRLPTSESSSSWLAQRRAGLPAEELARGLAATREHRSVQVDRLVSALLHQPAGPEAHAPLLTLLTRRGADTVIGRLASSRQYAATHRGARSFVQGLYADLLTRAPDRAELAGWLGAAARLGAGRAQIARAFARTPEVQARIAELFDPLGVLGNPPVRVSARHAGRQRVV